VSCFLSFPLNDPNAAVSALKDGIERLTGFEASGSIEVSLEKGVSPSHCVCQAAWRKEPSRRIEMSCFLSFPLNDPNAAVSALKDGIERLTVALPFLSVATYGSNGKEQSISPFRINKRVCCQTSRGCRPSSECRSG
jgi:hypothetical protein